LFLNQKSMLSAIDTNIALHEHLLGAMQRSFASRLRSTGERHSCTLWYICVHHYVRQFRILDSERWTFTRHADPDQEDLMNYDRTRLQPTMLYPICRMHRHSATFLGFQTWRKKLPYYYASPVEGYGWQLLCYWHRVNQAMDVRKPRTVYR
jgi:hypothetical protein